MSAGSAEVVTVSREYGSGGAALAAILATRLGHQLLDRALILKIAKAAGVAPGVAELFDERVDPWLHRLGRALWHGGIEGVAQVDESQVVDADRLADLGRRVVEEAGQIGGCVIVGHGAQCILRSPNVLHVFVYAPRSLRALHLRDRLGPEADVQTAMDVTDRERAAYLRRHFDADWKDPLLYDVMINSAVGHEAAARAVLAVIDAPRRPA